MFDKIVNNLHKLLVPALAIVAVGFAIYSVWGAQKETPVKPPYNAPAKSPYQRGVAGSGITEARTENIAIGSGVPGLVTEVFVKVGDVVEPGDRLFRIDDRALQADLKVRQAMLRASQTQLAKLDAMPRKEEVTPAEIKVAEAKAKVIEAQDRYARAEKLHQREVTTEEEFVQAKQAYIMAQEQAKWAEATHQLILAGAWKPDKAIAQATIEESQAQIDKIQIELERLEITAPRTMDVQKFKVLQVNVRPGEYVGAPHTQALIVLGDIAQLHVRVDIDEYDIPRFNPQAKATAKLRGTQDSFDLTFVRVDPYVIPKRSLTGDNTERVDTRVLQVIYALPKTEKPLYVGQQMDVFTEEK